jgi:anti-sigma regulatory factor (Ser/Thr protein kinase)
MNLVATERRSEIILGVRPEAAKVAREFVYNRLTTLGYSSLIDNGTLIACELVTNVVKHATGTQWIILGLSHNSGRPLIEVTDSLPVAPKLVNDPLGESGRGMHLVRELSTMWGCHLKPGGKTVWALLL